jgi:hypothetical protein
MKALISPQELVYNNNGEEIGYRVAEVTEVEFHVAEPLFWVSCNNSVVADQFYYSNGDILEKPIPAPVETSKPTLEQLQAQLATITAQMAALANTG